MKAIFEYISNEINKLEVKLENIKVSLLSYGYEGFLRNSACEALKSEFILEQLHQTKCALYDCDNVDDIIPYFDRKISEFEKQRLNSKPMSYNTNPMVNLISMWKFEAYVDIISHYKSLKNIANNHQIVL